MKQQDVRTIARNHHIKPDRSSKGEPIRKIQRKEGNFDCFASEASDHCDQHHGATTASIWRRHSAISCNRNLTGEKHDICTVTATGQRAGSQQIRVVQIANAADPRHPGPPGHRPLLLHRETLQLHGKLRMVPELPQAACGMAALSSILFMNHRSKENAPSGRFL